MFIPHGILVIPTIPPGFPRNWWGSVKYCDFLKSVPWCIKRLEGLFYIFFKICPGTIVMGGGRCCFFNEFSFQEEASPSSMKESTNAIFFSCPCIFFHLCPCTSCQRTPQSTSHYSRHLRQPPIHPSTQTTVVRPMCPTYKSDLRV